MPSRNQEMFRLSLQIHIQISAKIVSTLQKCCLSFHMDFLSPADFLEGKCIPSATTFLGLAVKY
jgi:hypothetical protein